MKWRLSQKLVRKIQIEKNGAEFSWGGSAGMGYP
jgi:hypothetical protein